MKENNIKKSFDNIEPGAGAQERMYANILKKAAAQRENKTLEHPDNEKRSAAEPKRRSAPAWQRWGSLAACLAIVIAVGVTLPHLLDRSEQNDPPVLGGSPFEDVDGPDDFEKLGFTIDAPEGAENLYYCIFDGEIARVDFTVAGHEYSYEAAKLEGNFSRADGEPVASTALNAQYDAVLDHVPADIWRAHWSCGDVSCYLTNFDGAEEADITAVVNMLLGQD